MPSPCSISFLPCSLFAVPVLFIYLSFSLPFPFSLSFLFLPSPGSPFPLSPVPFSRCVFSPFLHIHPPFSPTLFFLFYPSFIFSLFSLSSPLLPLFISSHFLPPSSHVPLSSFLFTNFVFLIRLLRMLCPLLSLVISYFQAYFLCFWNQIFTYLSFVWLIQVYFVRF